MSYLYVNRNKYERIRVWPFRDALPDLLPLPFPVWLQETLFPKLVRETREGLCPVSNRGCGISATSLDVNLVRHRTCSTFGELDVSSLHFQWISVALTLTVMLKHGNCYHNSCFTTAEYCFCCIFLEYVCWLQAEWGHLSKYLPIIRSIWRTPWRVCVGHHRAYWICVHRNTQIR